MATAESRETPLDSRAQDSRDEILKAATQLFASRGFHETSMAEIARTAHVSKALIFWHFKTKEDLFMAVLSGLLEPYFIDFTEEAKVLDEKAQIVRLLESYLRFVHDNASSIRFFIAQLLHDERSSSENLTGQVRRLYEGYRALLADLIGRAQDQGVCLREFQPQAVTSLILSTLNGLLMGLLFSGTETVDVAAAVAMLCHWLFRDAAAATDQQPLNQPR